MLCAGELRSAASEQVQHGRADIPVHSQSHLSGAQGLLQGQKRETVNRPIQQTGFAHCSKPRSKPLFKT